jgi:hypothetical protein
VHRVTFHHPPDIAGTTSKNKETVTQKVTVMSTEITVRTIIVKPSTMMEKYQQLCCAMKVSRPMNGSVCAWLFRFPDSFLDLLPFQFTPHPYLLELILSGADESASSASSSSAPLALRLSHTAAYLTSQALQPFLLSLEADTGRLHTLHLNTPSFDDECGLTLCHLLQQPTSPALHLLGLRELSLARSTVSPAVWRDLLPACVVLTSLTALDFSDTTIGDACMHSLDALLASDRVGSLTSLNLSGCVHLTGAFDEAGVAGVLACHTGIVHYAFDRTPLTHGCLVQLLRYLEDNPNLLSLSLAYMPCMLAPMAHTLYLDPPVKKVAVAAATTVDEVPVDHEFTSDRIVIDAADGADAEGATSLAPCDLADVDVYASLEYAPDMRTGRPALTPKQLELHDEVLQALLEFAVAYGQEREWQQKRPAKTNLNVRTRHANRRSGSERMFSFHAHHALALAMCRLMCPCVAVSCVVGCIPCRLDRWSRIHRIDSSWSSINR